jgi:hypothetical protein
MGTEAPPPIPDLSVVAEVIRLAEAFEAERYDQRPAGWPTYRADDPHDLFVSMPARHALLAFLRNQPDETIAALHARRLRAWTRGPGLRRV